MTPAILSRRECLRIANELMVGIGQEQAVQCELLRSLGALRDLLTRIGARAEVVLPDDLRSELDRGDTMIDPLALESRTSEACRPVAVSAQQPITVAAERNPCSESVPDGESRRSDGGPQNLAVVVRTRRSAVAGAFVSATGWR